MQKRYSNKIESVVTPQMSAFQYNVMLKNSTLASFNTGCVYLYKTSWNGIV